MAAWIVAPASSTSTTTEALSTTPRPVRLGLGLIDGQRASAKVRSVQSRNCFIGLVGICHLDKGKAARAPRVAVCNQADLLHRSVGFEHVSQFGFGCAVG